METAPPSPHCHCLADELTHTQRRINELVCEERATRAAHRERVHARKQQRATLQARDKDGLAPRLPLSSDDKRYHAVVAELLALDAHRDKEWLHTTVNGTVVRCQKSRNDTEAISSGTFVRSGRHRPPTPPGFWDIAFEDDKHHLAANQPSLAIHPAHD